jgi:hypothetical protein
MISTWYTYYLYGFYNTFFNQNTIYSTTFAVYGTRSQKITVVGKSAVLGGGIRTKIGTCLRRLKMNGHPIY